MGMNQIQKTFALFLLGLVSFSFLHTPLNARASARQAQDTSLKFRLWSEFENWDSVKKKFPALAKYPVTFHIAIPQNEIEDANLEPTARFHELVSLMKEAHDHRIPVFIWPLLDKKDGYWLNQWNAKLFSDFVLRLKSRLQTAGASFEGVSMDIELHIEKMKEYGALARKLKLGSLRKKLKADHDPKQFDDALKTIQDLCLKLRAENIRTHAVTLPFVLEDFLHKSKKPQYVQRLLGLPIPYGYVDDLSVMSYRSVYQVALGAMNSRIVHEHAKHSRRYFVKSHTQVSIDVGIVGDMEIPSKLKGFKNPEELRRDVIASRAAGVHHIGVYALDGMDDVDAWLNQDFTPKKPKKSFRYGILNGLISGLYNLLNP